jgi:hypothetical protein
MTAVICSLPQERPVLAGYVLRVSEKRQNECSTVGISIEPPLCEFGKQGPFGGVSELVKPARYRAFDLGIKQMLAYDIHNVFDLQGSSR